MKAILRCVKGAGAAALLVGWSLLTALAAVMKAWVAASGPGVGMHFWK